MLAGHSLSSHSSCCVVQMNHLPDHDSKPVSPNACDLIQDFVVVSLQESREFSCDDSDDDSYDYCEDVYYVIPNRGNGHASLSDSQELKDSILTVPSVLMKDLDEAHAAATLAQISDFADSSAGGTSTLGSSEESKAHDEFDEQHCSDSASSEEGEIESYSSAVMDEEAPVSTGFSSGHVVDCKKATSSSARSNESSFTSTSSDHLVGPGMETVESFTPKPSTSFTLTLVSIKNHQNACSLNKVDDGSNMSRTSNKKRRKQLKLLKKAQAAASAAHKLTERSCETMKLPIVTTAANHPHLQQQKLRMRYSPSRGSSKKIANIAVVCAKETMSAYREELMRTKQTSAGA